MTLNHLFSAVGNTLLATGLCIAIAVPLGAIAAVLLFRSNAMGRGWAVLVLASQLAIPLYVFAGGWSAGVGLQGWMRIAEWLGPTGVGWMQGWLGSLLAVGLIHALAAIPWCCLLIGMGLISSDRAEEEMALLEGGWPALVRWVWLPKLRVWIAAACLWCSVGLLTEMVVSNLYMFGTVAEMVYLDFSRQMPSPLTYFSAVLLCILPLWAGGLALVGRLPSLQSVLSRPHYFGAVTIGLGKWRGVISLALWIALGILVGLPIWNLLMKAGWTPQPTSDGRVTYGWGGGRFLQTVQESITLFRTEYYWSWVLAVCSTLAALLLGSLLFMGTQFLGQRWRRSVHLVMFLLIAVPGPLVGILLAQLLNRPWPEWLGRIYSTTLAAPILAQQFRLLPFCWVLICATMASIPQRSWELAQQDSLSKLQKFRIIIWPQTWPKWMALTLLLMLLSVGELSCSMGVLPPGVTTTSMRLFEILHFGMRHQDSAICGILILFGWLAALVMAWAVKRTE